MWGRIKLTRTRKQPSTLQLGQIVLFGLAPQLGRLAPFRQRGLNQAFKRAMERAERKGWSFHDLRHFFVTELFRNRAPAIAVQQLAGHADLTTQRYADFDANDLRSAIECIDGKDVEMRKSDTPPEP